MHTLSTTVRLRLCALALTALILLSFSGCGLISGKDSEADDVTGSDSLPEEDPEYPVHAAGAKLQSRPGKIVSLAPLTTEKILDFESLYNLNLSERLIGVSDDCEYLDAVRDIPSCGTAALPDLELLSELKPHLVLTPEPLSDEMVEALEELGAQVAVIPYTESLEDWYEQNRNLAMLLEGRRSGGELGDAFTAQVKSRLSRMAAGTAPYSEEPATVLYLAWLDFSVATGDTLVHELLTTAGMHNAAREQEDWLYPEELAHSEAGIADFQAIDALFFDERDIDIKMLEANPFYKVLPAVLQDRYLLIDATAFECQSLRMLDEIERMARYCYPEAEFGEPDKGEDGQDEEAEQQSDSDPEPDAEQPEGQATESVPAVS